MSLIRRALKAANHKIFLMMAWDDNFSPKSFKRIKYLAKFITKNKIKYSVGDTSYKIVEQFLYGSWDAYH